MECACLCDIPDYYPDVRNVSEPKARKQHVCLECREPIEPGQKYELYKELYEREWRTYKTCLPCSRIRASFCACYGELRHELQELLGFDYVTGESCYWAEDDDDETEAT